MLFRAALLLAALFAGQYRDSDALASQPPIPSAQTPAIQAAGKYLVRVNGVDFWVSGTKNANGTISVDWTDKDNLKSYWNAVADSKRPLDNAQFPSADETTGTVVNPSSLNFGLDISKLSRPQPTYTTNSEAGRAYAKSVDEGAANSGLHVTIIGEPEHRQAAVDDFKRNPELAALTKEAKIQVQDYDPSSWAIDPSLGFPRDGKPTILAQTPKGPGDPKGGLVVYANSGYPGPSKLAADLRKADPNYKPGTPNGELPFGITPNQIGAAVVGALFSMIPSRKGR